jgi:hypothetical protein
MDPATPGHQPIRPRSPCDKLMYYVWRNKTYLRHANMVKNFILLLVIALFSSASYANPLSVENESASSSNNYANNRLNKMQQEIYKLKTEEAVNDGNIKEESHEFTAVETSIDLFSIIFSLVAAGIVVFGLISVKSMVSEKTEMHIEGWIKNNSQPVLDKIKTQLDDAKNKIETKIVLIYKELSDFRFAAENDYKLIRSIKKSAQEDKNNTPYSHGEEEINNKSINQNRESLSDDE